MSLLITGLWQVQPLLIYLVMSTIPDEYFIRGSIYDLDVPMPNREILEKASCTKVPLHGMR